MDYFRAFKVFNKVIQDAIYLLDVPLIRICVQASWFFNLSHKEWQHSDFNSLVEFFISFDYETQILRSDRKAIWFRTYDPEQFPNELSSFDFHVPVWANLQVKVLLFTRQNLIKGTDVLLVNSHIFKVSELTRFVFELPQTSFDYFETPGWIIVKEGVRSVLAH